MIVKEILAKSIITKSNLPEADFVINPYTGCSHACNYCYAEFMKKWSNHFEPWGEFVDVKSNALDLIDSPEKYSDKTILLSSVTDPYQPLEAKYQLTRRILEALIPVQPKIGILTKSRLVSRDIDVFR